MLGGESGRTSSTTRNPYQLEIAAEAPCHGPGSQAGGLERPRPGIDVRTTCSEWIDTVGVTELQPTGDVAGGSGPRVRAGEPEQPGRYEPPERESSGAAGKSPGTGSRSLMEQHDNSHYHALGRGQLAPDPAADGRRRRTIGD